MTTAATAALATASFRRRVPGAGMSTVDSCDRMRIVVSASAIAASCGSGLPSKARRTHSPNCRADCSRSSGFLASARLMIVSQACDSVGLRAEGSIGSWRSTFCMIVVGERPIARE